jgi:hypothetical protein
METREGAKLRPKSREGSTYNLAKFRTRENLEQGVAVLRCKLVLVRKYCPEKV